MSLPLRSLLVDSGADVTVITRSEGTFLGMSVQPDEPPLRIRGFKGETVEGYRRMVELQIAGRTFEAPVFWTDSDEVSTVLGREVVFDLFDIDIRQADQRVIFWWRKDWRYRLWRSLERVVLRAWTE
jgi:hypothetical protein